MRIESSQTGRRPDSGISRGGTSGRTSPLPDAFFSATPLVAFALLHSAAETRWRVPEETQIIGYANDMTRAQHRSGTDPYPPAARRHRRTRGRTSGSYVRSGVEIPETTLLEAEFVQGETTRK